MGIDLHNLHFLAHAQDLGARFDRTVAIGRQALFVEERELDAHRSRRGLPALVEPARLPGALRYFEPLVQQWLGAGTVDAVDASAYEGARLVHDMNRPWPAEASGRGSYDAVLDFGTLEHVFDFPTAWRNCVDLCRVGGHLLHALPANNLTGHGFYQFSPELFFNLYQRSRGFALKALYLAVKADGRHWWRVADPTVVHRRVTLRNVHEVYMLVLAQKLVDAVPTSAPQQSDYAEGDWLRDAPAGQPPPSMRSWRSRATGVLAGLGALEAARLGVERVRGWRASGLALPTPDYERLIVADLLQRPTGR